MRCSGREISGMKLSGNVRMRIATQSRVQNTTDESTTCCCFTVRLISQLSTLYTIPCPNQPSINGTGIWRQTPDVVITRLTLLGRVARQKEIPIMNGTGLRDIGGTVGKPWRN